MNQKTKYVGILTLLPLLTVVLSVPYIGDAEAASVEQSYIRAENLKMGSYEVIYKVYAGDEPLEGGKLLITSDRQSKEVLFSGAIAGQYSSVKILVLADDPASLRAEIVGKENKKVDLSADDGSQIDFHAIVQEEKNFYKVTFWIHAIDEDLDRGLLVIESDRTSVEVPHGRANAGTHTGVTALIPADNPNSITAHFGTFDIHKQL